MIRLVTDLLQLSKMDSKDYKFNFVQTDLVQFLQDIIDRFEMLQHEHLRFIRNLPERKIMVQIDTDKMTQVVDNVISNAIKYSPEGGTISISASLHGRKIKVSISDQGSAFRKTTCRRSLTGFSV